MNHFDLLLERKQTLEDTLKKERQRLHQMAESVDWLAGINKPADKPIFKFEKKLIAELRVVEDQMSSLKL
jgi:hypothetical protein